ncbi:hypothetical protein SHIRM173S_02645 [Streptomyces hirsutus]
MGAPFDEFPDAAWDKVLGVNVKTPFTLAKLARPLLEAGAAAGDAPARIINIGSIDGLAVPNYENYVLGGQGRDPPPDPAHGSGNPAPSILVNAIAPGPFPTKDDEVGALMSGATRSPPPIRCGGSGARRTSPAS